MLSWTQRPYVIKLVKPETISKGYQKLYVCIRFQGLYIHIVVQLYVLYVDYRMLKTCQDIKELVMMCFLMCLKFCVCMHVFFFLSVCMFVMWLGLSVSFVSKKEKKYKVNMSSPGSFWSFWPFSTSVTTRGEKEIKKEMFRISTLLVLPSHWVEHGVLIRRSRTLFGGGGWGVGGIINQKKKICWADQLSSWEFGGGGEGLVGNGQTPSRTNTQSRTETAACGEFK